MSSTVNVVRVPSFRDYRAARRRQLRTALSQYWGRVRSRCERSDLGTPGLNDVGMAHVEVRQKSSRLLRPR